MATDWVRVNVLTLASDRSDGATALIKQADEPSGYVLGLCVSC
jgi:hypothetical protein